MLDKYQISSLSLLNTSADHWAVKTLMEGVLKCPTLRSLDLTNNCLGSEGARFVAKALPELPSLQYINLTKCKLGRGLAAVAGVVSSCPNLQEVNLKENQTRTEIEKNQENNRRMILEAQNYGVKLLLEVPISE
eukprot:TRINITY_DN9430_c0_g1_i1.p1 TRINITY_DN9430_c0_g1~~TRINITY_DN9430_c0_g1_i1.p1  ORF type:complete len:134 (-),score=26.86 TRINITY_DN9430_c0_g1_i1:247-648(-)